MEDLLDLTQWKKPAITGDKLQLGLRYIRRFAAHTGKNIEQAHHLDHAGFAKDGFRPHHRSLEILLQGKPWDYEWIGRWQSLLVVTSTESVSARHFMNFIEMADGIEHTSFSIREVAAYFCGVDGRDLEYPLREFLTHLAYGSIRPEDLLLPKTQSAAA